MRFTAVMALAALSLPAAVAAAPAGGPVQRIGAYDDAIVAIMKARLPMKARVDRFQSLVRSYYDMPAIAALVAGPGWASAGAGERAAMTAALTRHSAISLAKNFKSYDGETFTVDPAVQSRAGGSVVKVTIRGGSSSDTLYFQMRQGGGEWRIVDVVADGVSQLAVQRADLASTVAAGGVAAVARRLDQIDAKAVR